MVLRQAAGEIGRHACDLARMVAGEIGGDGIDLTGIASVDDDRASLLQKPDSRCVAETAGRTRDQDPTTGEEAHAHILPAVLPPSMATDDPVMKFAAGEARQSTKSAISSGLARRLSG